MVHVQVSSLKAPELKNLGLKITGLKITGLNVPRLTLRMASVCSIAVWASAALVSASGTTFAQSQSVPHSKPSLHDDPAIKPAHSTIVAQESRPGDSGWAISDTQVEMARCNHLLRALDMTFKPMPAVRENDCGAAAPVEVSAIGKSPQMTFNPPVVVTCDMAAGLHRWVTKELQPLARKTMGASLVRMETMSSYSCRNAYGRRHTRLSEHGRANALDIRAFTTTNGITADVLADWGPTSHEIAAQVAAAKKLEATQPAAIAKTNPAAQKPAVPGAPAVSTVATGSNPVIGQPSGTVAGTTGLADMTRPSISIGSRAATGGAASPLPLPGTLSHDSGIGIFGGGIGSAFPTRLGGPKAADAPTPQPGKMDFLRGAHAAACRVFATTLGPEANAQHRNHFHIDMSDRKSKAICE